MCQITENQNTLKKKLIKSQGEINESSIIVGDFNTPLSEMDRSVSDK